ncbi:MAG: hypothetical protein H7A50_13575 [Akkermansiaceae bacterium]|nr:hypothetical protein [Akkermansiaceae bacterium]
MEHPSASVSAGLANKDWSLDTPPDDPETPRSYQIDVAFAASFAAPPVVHLGLCGFDSDQRDSTRISIRPTDITCGGFGSRYRPSVTRLYGVEISGSRSVLVNPRRVILLAAPAFGEFEFQPGEQQRHDALQLLRTKRESGDEQVVAIIHRAESAPIRRRRAPILRGAG